MSLSNFPEFSLFLETNPAIPGLQVIVACKQHSIDCYYTGSDVVTFFSRAENALAKELHGKSFKIVGNNFIPVEADVINESSGVNISTEVSEDDDGENTVSSSEPVPDSQ